MEDVWSHTAVLAPPGCTPSPERLAAHAGLGPMSDALLQLLEPYVWWPPMTDLNSDEVSALHPFKF